MHITYTDAAAGQIKSLMNIDTDELKLVFDNEGCGCTLSGVPTLWIVDSSETDDLKAEGEPFTTKYRKRDEVFFEDKMKIDYNPQRMAFSLSSSGQIYNAMMSLVDKRQ
ncbi:iron-sulfur cluster biosynthesis family protein [Paenibacillus gansuensis]|uniref:Iron-sulfur cluster biosynthesis family protein n=1 Tax=Paenibacillus gansuensis TaxID=306542 RepID=A0ABW5PA18_9BACL